MNRTRSAESGSRKRIERLVALGCNFNFPACESGTELRLRVEQIPEPLGSYARMTLQGTLYVLWVRIVAFEKVVIDDFYLSSTSWDLMAWLLDTPSERMNYETGDGVDFMRQEVLNHRTGKEWMLRRGEVMEGLLLFRSFKLIPEHFCRPGMMPFTLSIRDHFGDVHNSTLYLCVEPSSKKIVMPGTKPGSLFEPFDGSPSCQGTAESPIAPREERFSGSRKFSGGGHRVPRDKVEEVRMGEAGRKNGTC